MSIELILGNKAYSSWSLRGWLSLRKAGVVFSEINLSLFTPECEKEIVGLSPTGKVPVLRDGFYVIHDSLAIAEYIAEKYPAAGLWPTDRAQRAYARSISCEMHAGFTALRTELPFNCRVNDRKVDVSKECQKDIERVDAVWSACRKAATDGPWLFGQFSIADVMYLPIASRLHTYNIEVSSESAAYIDTCLSDNDMLSWVDAANKETAVIEKYEVGKLSS